MNVLIQILPNPPYECPLPQYASPLSGEPFDTLSAVSMPNGTEVRVDDPIPHPKEGAGFPP
jgi:hypothetical protein